MVENQKIYKTAATQQASCLEQLLCITYTNDLSLTLANSNAYMFVDDTTATAGAYSQTKRQQYLPNDLRRVSRGGGTLLK